MYLLEKRQFINRPLPEVFDFFKQPENLSIITPPWLGFNILTPKPIVMKAGTLIDYTVSPLGFPIHWTTLITEVDAPNRFVDVQKKGPYSSWHHTHYFESVEGGTLIRDEVRYSLPFGWLGNIAHFVKVRRQLNEIFDFREKKIREIFPDGAAKP